MKALGMQHGGGHYQGLKIQPVEFAMACVMGFCEGSVIKYVTRWREKGGIEDLRKARHFIQYILEAPAYQSFFTRIRRALLIYVEAMIADHYIRENNLPRHEAGVVRHIAGWNITGEKAELVGAMKWMDELIGLAEAEQVQSPRDRAAARVRRMEQALRKVQSDVFWMNRNKKVLSADWFDYVGDALKSADGR